jgi:hypothetical protein
VRQRVGPPPRGARPPAVGTLPDGTELELAPIAREICRRHLEAHPAEVDRYGDDGRLWCEHDNRWILGWAIRSAGGHDDLERQISWLARVLESRAFPLAWLASNLDMAADELLRASPAAAAPAGLLRAEAARVRETPTFLDDVG